MRKIAIVVCAIVNLWLVGPSFAATSLAAPAPRPPQGMHAGAEHIACLEHHRTEERIRRIGIAPHEQEERPPVLGAIEIATP